MTESQRGFPTEEYRRRLERAQAMLQAAALDALLLTTEPAVRYFTGYLTRFWESPTRPWFLVVPASGDPVAVIPSIGVELMAKTWISDVRSWRSPDLEDDGVSILAATLRELVGKAGRVGLPMGQETHLRMPLADFAALKKAVAPIELCADDDILKRLRLVKSPAEVEKVRQACAIAGRVFARMPALAREGMSLGKVFRTFQIACLEEGADWVPYLAGGAGQGGYGDVISPAGETALASGDILMLDTGLVWDGYFCDFDRNYAIGDPGEQPRAAYARLMEATAAGLEAAKPGATASEVFHAMDRIVTGGKGGSDAGRLGHGLGMQLTEWPSLMAGDHTVIEAGMVLTLEPGIELAPGRIMVHEDNIVVGAEGSTMLSPAAPESLPVIG